MRMPPTELTYFPLRGGLNLVSPPLSIPDGMCIDASNFEAYVDGGYRRVGGYERFDGRPAPSEALYYIINCTFSAAVVAGNTITGATSGATGIVVAVTADSIIFTKKTGTFVSTENLQVGGVTKATATSGATAGSASTGKLNAQYTNLAADSYRADIQAVPGSGSVLGVWVYKDVAYAFRNNAGATAAVMHKSTGSGWSAVDLGYQVEFSNANTSVTDGDTLTQGGVTATVRRVVVETGTLVSGVNTGRLIIGAPSGGNFAAGAATSTGGGSVTLGGAQSAITIAPGGRYEFTNHNFGGASGTLRMYGASGADKAFEFDGTAYVPIRTGMSAVADTPTHVAAHSNHLFLTFGSSLQHSSVADPYRYTILAGAGELGVGDDVTGLMPITGSNMTKALAVTTRNKTLMLYGASSADWSLVELSNELGALPYTMQNIGDGFTFDTLGARRIIATDAFGNFSSAFLTYYIKPYIEQYASTCNGSCISRDLNQYRVQFSGGKELRITVSGQDIIGVMPIEYAHSMNCIGSWEKSNGDEIILAGGTDGFVYRMDSGTSFDGSAINGHINLAFSFMKSPRLRKRFRKILYEITGNSYMEFDAGYELGYGSTEIDQSPPAALSGSLGSVYWDSFVWDSFYWDGRSLIPREQDVTGTAENISIIIRVGSDEHEPFIINSAMIHYTNRRQLR